MTRAALALPTVEVVGAGTAPTQPSRRSSGVRRILSTLVVVGAIAVLWPAQFGGITGLTIVNGHSMEPTYVTGDLVVTVRQFGYLPGDVVSYTVPEGQPGAGGRVIHRVIDEDAVSAATGADGAVLPFVSQGDNNPDVDPWRFGAADVMGRAVFAVPGVGSLIGSLGNPLVVGLGVGLLVTVVLWPKRAPMKARIDEGAVSP